MIKLMKNSGLTVRNKPQMLSFNIKIPLYPRLTMLHSFNTYMKPAMFIHDKSVSSVKRVISDQYIRRCRLRPYQVWRRCGSGLWRAARGWDGCRQPSPPRHRSSTAALWSPQSQPELTLQEKSEAFNAYKKKYIKYCHKTHVSHGISKANLGLKQHADTSNVLSPHLGRPHRAWGWWRNVGSEGRSLRQQEIPLRWDRA